MSSNQNKKLVAILGGRLYENSLTLRQFLIPSIRKKLQEQNIDFVIATNNKKAASQFKQLPEVKLLECSDEFHESFMNRQREEKPNLGAETREIINQYAIENNYEYVLYLDDNIRYLLYTKNGKRLSFKRHPHLAFYHTMMLLFSLAENTNAGAVGMEMCAFAPTNGATPKLTAGFAYSFFVQKVDKSFVFENATEEDILMNIYNGNNKKPSLLLRNLIAYSKTGKKNAGGGNRKLYNEMLKENKRGTYANKMFPHIYTMKVSYNVISSTNQKTPFLQHKHTLKKPKEWDGYAQYDKAKVYNIIREYQKTIETNFL
jgi:hypothetical protein